MKARQKVIQDILKQLSEKIKVIPDKNREWSHLERQYNVYAEMYSRLLEKREEAYLARRLDLEDRGTRFRIIDSPQIPIKHYKGK